MRLIALTGNIAAGKSTAAELLRARGAATLDLDRIVRELQQPGQPVYRAIVERFGMAVVGPAGELDRRALRDLILASPRARLDLEQIVHPATRQQLAGQLERLRKKGTELVIVEIPLLFETADPAEYQGIILVDAPVSLRRERLISERGLSPEVADGMLRAQIPADLKRERSTWIIDNDGDIAHLEDQIHNLWQELNR